MKIHLIATNTDYEVISVGAFTPHPIELPDLSVGEVGFIIANIKTIKDTKIGDTITETERPGEPLPGFKLVKPMVFAGIFPTDSARYVELREALEKLALNDSSFTYEAETSLALGFGFRCGFLGLLHMEIVQERLEREYDMDLIVTAPTVRYRLHMNDGEVREVANPAEVPDAGKYHHIEEPIIAATIHVPQEYVGNIITLYVQERRGTLQTRHSTTTPATTACSSTTTFRSPRSCSAFTTR